MREVFTIEFAYSYSDGVYHHAQEISRRHYKRLKEGDEVKITYLKRAPNRVVLLGKDADYYLLVQDFGVGFVYLIVSLYLINLLGQYSR